MSEPERPSSDDENACPMPESGCDSPSLSEVRTSEDPLVPASSDWMTELIEPIVPIRPQKVPSRPRKTSRPIR